MGAGDLRLRRGRRAVVVLSRTHGDEKESVLWQEDEAAPVSVGTLVVTEAMKESGWEKESSGCGRANNGEINTPKPTPRSKRVEEDRKLERGEGSRTGEDKKRSLGVEGSRAKGGGERGEDR